jgi:hypothetical protein
MAGKEDARDLTGWDKLVAFLKGAISKIANGLGVKIPITDDMVRDFVAGARRAGFDGAHVSTQPSENSKGQPIASTPEATRNFWNWFGDSQVADEQGRPLVVYHGTVDDVSAFDMKRTGQRTGNKYGKGAAFFTDNANAASAYAAPPYGEAHPLDKPNVVVAYLSLKNPLIIDGEQGLKRGEGWRSWTHFKEQITQAQKDGHDGVILRNVLDHASAVTAVQEGAINTYIAFHPEQIKSATGNNGEFNPSSSAIRYSRTADPRDAAAFADRARDTFNDFASTSKTFNWWNKTVGTQYQKAAEGQALQAVFDATQDYILDVSRLANDAPTARATCCRGWSHLKDVLKDTPLDKDRTTEHRRQGDREADLPGHAGRQARVQGRGAEARVRPDRQAGRAVQAVPLRGEQEPGRPDHQHGCEAAAQRGLRAGHDPGRAGAGRPQGAGDFAAEAAEHDPKLKGMADQVKEISDRAEKLKAEGYAPLMRFGQYAVSLRDPKTNALLEFHLFENEREANAEGAELASKGKVDRA